MFKKDKPEESDEPLVHQMAKTVLISVAVLIIPKVIPHIYDAVLGKIQEDQKPGTITALKAS